MKKKLIIGVAVLSMAIGFVGCTSASVSNTTSTSNDNSVMVSVGRQIDDNGDYITYESFCESITEDNQELYYEPIMIGANSFDEQILQIREFEEKIAENDEIITNLEKPAFIETDITTSNGQTILTYSGTYSIGNENEQSYFNEYIFDFEFYN